MGCDYQSSVLSSFKNELNSEIIIKHKFLIPKNENSIEINGQISKRKLFYLKAIQNIGEIGENSHIKNLSVTHTFNHLEKNNDLNFSDNVKLRLSVEKFNELFDDNINVYYNNTMNRKDIKHISFNSNDLFLSNKNKNSSNIDIIEINSFESTLESENCKNKNIKSRK